MQLWELKNKNGRLGWTGRWGQERRKDSPVYCECTRGLTKKGPNGPNTMALRGAKELIKTAHKWRPSNVLLQDEDGHVYQPTGKTESVPGPRGKSSLLLAMAVTRGGPIH